LPSFLLEVSLKLSINVGLVADVILLEPSEVALKHLDTDRFHAIEDLVFLWGQIALPLELLVYGIFH
jgi:hypothetical protein